MNRCGNFRQWMLLFLVSGVQVRAADQGWPILAKVEAQPLLAQANRVRQALDQLGQPLPNETRQSLESLTASLGDAQVAAGVQRILDPFCVAAIEIDETGISRVVRGSTKSELVEQGWRCFLVKVANRGGSTGSLRSDSPNARSLANSPKEEVASRWLGLLPYTGQPLLPNLSGLELEYTIVQLYSRDAGEKTGELVFTLEEGQPLKKAKPGPTIREWRFTKDLDGWKAAHDCTIAVTDNQLQVTSEGIDPYLIAPVSAPKGRMVLRFWAKFDQPGVGQVFWSTKQKSLPDGSTVSNFQVEPGRGVEYTVRINAQDELTAIRLDPGSGKGLTRFDWITLASETEPDTSGKVSIDFVAQPSIPVTFQVTEADGQPATGAFVITDLAGRVYPAQSKRLAPDFFFQRQVYRASGEQVLLPSGRYKVLCTHGPESIPEVTELLVADKPVEFRYQVKRWIDPSKAGWWSGDHHIHAAGCLHYENPTEGVEPSDMMRHIMGEDLKIGCCLTWGPCFDYQKQFFRGRPDDVSKPPFILRYDVEVSGFGSHASGHLCLLRLKEQIYPGGTSKNHWPTLGLNTLRWAKKQGAICGPAHSAIGLERTVGRVPGAVDGPNGLPHYNIPAYNGIGANEFIMNVPHQVPGPDGRLVPAVDFISTMDTDRITELNMWYHVLNCGFRVRASGETDFPCLTGERVGLGRGYAKIDGPADFDRYVQAIADGRMYVSNGLTHLMDLRAEVGGRTYEPGVAESEIQLAKSGRIRLTVNATARDPGKSTVPVEVVVNGLPVATQALPCDGEPRLLTFDVEIPASCWVAVRVFPSAHTNPLFVLVGDKPIRASKASAQWCLMGVDQCWTMKKGTYKSDELAQAELDYDYARKAYQRIIAECEK